MRNHAAHRSSFLVGWGLIATLALALHQCVAVRRRFRREFKTDVAAGAERKSGRRPPGPALRQAFPLQARQYLRCAGGDGGNITYGFFGIFLRVYHCCGAKGMLANRICRRRVCTSSVYPSRTRRALSSCLRPDFHKLLFCRIIGNCSGGIVNGRANSASNACNI